MDGTWMENGWKMDGKVVVVVLVVLVVVGVVVVVAVVVVDDVDDLLSSSLLLFDSSHLCFSSVHTVRIFTSKLPSKSVYIYIC